MLRINKILIENFKGIQLKQVINFDSLNLSILNGPNGFGKTTIFDAIELCLSGKLERTMSFRNVTKNTINHKKPFYQNTLGKDVIIKVSILDVNTGKNHIIIKRLDKNHNGKVGTSKSFKIDAWDIIETYYSTNPADFDQDINFDTLPPVDQATIDHIFYSSGEVSLSNLYPLFNYLQQEENIYFLKKDEEEKKEELNFLFQTQKEAGKLEELTNFLKNIKTLKKELQDKIKVLGTVLQPSTSSPYNRLFPSKEIGYDKDEPFSGINVENLSLIYEGYKSEIYRLSEFITAFDIQEYNKDKLRLSLNVAIKDNSVLNAFCLQHFLADEQFRTLEQLYLKRERINFASTRLDTFKITDEDLLELGFDKIFIDLYRKTLANKYELENGSGTIEKIITDLNNARSTTIQKFLQLNTQKEQKPNCPLCNQEWASISDLLTTIEQKTKTLNEYNNIQINALSEISETLNINFIEVIREHIEMLLASPTLQFDSKFYSKVVELRGFKDRIGRFMAILNNNNLRFDQFILSNPVSNVQLEQHTEQFVLELTKAVSEIIIDQNKLINKQLFKELFDEDLSLLISQKELDSKLLFLNLKYDSSRIFSLNIFNSRLAKLAELEDRIDAIKTGLGNAIKKYKSEMIKRIKIPFYIYSGKILQNHQQGLGIFVDINETTSRIKFLTDSESDHDIIHHLSSGQLAVVSIAFCLSLNKVYQIKNPFKFLAIDDPVQTLDDINIHSFIELIRHDFNDHQIIMSTHEDDIANYIQYKFTKFGIDCKKMKVQDLFFSSREK